MNNVEVLKQQLMQDVMNLPEDKLIAVREFITNLTPANGVNGTEVDLDTASDPMLKFIGRISHGSLSDNIDEELYGEVPNPLLDYIGGVSHGALSANIDKELYGE